MHTPKKRIGRSKLATQAKQIKYHSDNMTGSDAHPAICVKYYGGLPVSADNLPQNVRESIWDGTVETFWRDAKYIAIEHGYSGVFSEGRSSGWLVPYFQYINGKLQTGEWTGQGPDKGYPSYPDVTDSKHLRQFVAFQKDILELLAGIPEMLETYIKEELR